MGRSRGGFSTKIHVRVDGYGRPFKIILSGGESHDMVFASKLTEQCESYYLLADKGYDSDILRTDLIDKGIQPVIPFKSNRNVIYDYDKELYKERNVVERFFLKLKQFRRIATRYDKTAKMFYGSIIMASILIWLKL